MKITLTRTTFGDSTIGRLLVNGVFQCWTLEDKVREILGRPVAEWKVQNQTAIPVGEYEVKLTFSGRFQKVLPILLNVPGFSGIRIHAGNTKEDTEGCILLGLGVAGSSITQSRAAMTQFQSKLELAIKAGERVTVKVEGLPNA
jgi:hypothetical protein